MATISKYPLKVPGSTLWQVVHTLVFFPSTAEGSAARSGVASSSVPENNVAEARRVMVKCTVKSSLMVLVALLGEFACDQCLRTYMQQYEFYSSICAKYQLLLILQYKYFLDKQRSQQRPSIRAKNITSA
jgi:hypothetical protein